MHVATLGQRIARAVIITVGASLGGLALADPAPMAVKARPVLASRSNPSPNAAPEVDRRTAPQAAPQATTPAVAMPAPVIAPADKPTRPSLWFRFGERIEWSLQVRGAEGGRARLAVGQPGRLGDRTVVAVKGDARTTGIVESIKHVVEESQSYLDVFSTLPVISEIRGEHGKDIVTGKVTRTDDGQAEVLSARSKSGESKQTVTIFPKTHDGLSALAMLRSLPSLREGSTRTFIVYTGVKAWRVTGTYSKRETRTTALGEMEVFRVDGLAQRSQLDGTLMADKPGKKFTGWFSADRRRVPVLFEADSDYGKVSLVVTGYAVDK